MCVCVCVRHLGSTLQVRSMLGQLTQRVSQANVASFLEQGRIAMLCAVVAR